MRIKSTLQQKITLKFVILLSSSVILLLFLGFMIFINLADYRNAYGAPANGDYRSNVVTGNWSASGSWQKYNGSAWAAAGSAPNSGNGVITILSGHTITVTANATVDQVIVNSGGTLIINSGITLTLNNGTGTDLDVTGIVKNAGTITINAGAAIVYQNGGKYQHNYTTTAGVIPTATWSTGSECEIIGYTSNAATPTGLQAFYDFTWNCASQASDINLNGGITTINGTLTVNATGTKKLYFSNANTTLNVGVDYVQTGGSFVLASAGTASIINVSNNYTQSGGTFTLSASSTATGTLNLAGDFSLTSGTLDAVNGSNSNGIINLSGNMTHTGGTITVTGSGTSNALFVFKNTGSQIFTASGNTVTGSVDYQVNSGSIVNLGTSFVLGRNFTLLSGGGLLIGSPNGITSSGATGNVQVSGARSFNTVADYTFSGVAAQVTGNGLPATVRNFTVNNAANVTLTDTVAVTGILAFTNGKLITDVNEMNVTNTSVSAITGNTTSKYVVGNLRRSVSGSGSYNFPIGTTANSELANVNLATTTGVSNIHAHFTNADPVVPALPLGTFFISGVLLDQILTYGYWTITPNSAIITGTATVTVTEKGQTNSINSGCTYALVNRTDNGYSWASVGTHNNGTQVFSGGAVTAARSALTVFGDFAIIYGEMLTFTGATIVSGVAGSVNTIYKFPDVCSNVDAWVQILSLDGGATLAAIDNNTTGYNDGWQPFLNAPANSTSSILWQIQFKVAGTSTDTIMPWVAMTGIDIDGGTNLQEFVEATMPYSFSLGPGSILSISNTNGNYRATSTFAQAGNIDTSAYMGMFQVKYNNTNKFYYRMGSINNSGSSSQRQNSYFFKSFFSGNQALPVKLLYFDGKLKDGIVKLSWATGSETNNSYFSVERSDDGKTFETISKQRGANNSTITLYYAATDAEPLTGKSYYRLKQTDFDGKYTYSNIIIINNFNDGTTATLDIKNISPNPFSDNCTVNFFTKSKEVVNIYLINSSGQIVSKDQIQSSEGFNEYEFSNLNDLSTGIYFVSLISGDQKITKKVFRK